MVGFATLNWVDTTKTEMASPSWLDSIDSELKCPLCSNILKNAKLLNCNHRFCRDCLEDFFSKTPALKDTDTVTVNCPVCRDEFRDGKNVIEDVKLEGVKKFEGRVVNLEGIKRDGWGVNDITSCTLGIIVSGAKIGKSVISVFNEIGYLLFQLEVPTDCVNYKPWRYCSFLTEAKVVSVCQPNEIGIFDIFLKTSLKQKIISQENADWKEDRVVSCVATANVVGATEDRIFVGGKYSRDVFVFDADLSCVRILTLPEMIAWPKDMAVHKDILVVCDLQGKKACGINFLQGGLQAEYEPPRPNAETESWAPISVCTGKNGDIFVLWKATVGKPNRVLVQYSPESGHKLTERPVHEDARCLSTFESEESEKLLVATFGCGKIYIMEY